MKWFASILEVRGQQHATDVRRGARACPRQDHSFNANSIRGSIGQHYKHVRFALASLDVATTMHAPVEPGHGKW